MVGDLEGNSYAGVGPAGATLAVVAVARASSFALPDFISSSYLRPSSHLGCNESSALPTGKFGTCAKFTG